MHLALLQDSAPGWLCFFKATWLKFGELSECIKFSQLVNSCWVAIRHQMHRKLYSSPVLPSVVEPDVSGYVYRSLDGPLLFPSWAQPAAGAAPVLRFSSKCRIYSCECLLVSS